MRMLERYAQVSGHFSPGWRQVAPSLRLCHRPGEGSGRIATSSTLRRARAALVAVPWSVSLTRRISAAGISSFSTYIRARVGPPSQPIVKPYGVALASTSSVSLTPGPDPVWHPWI